MRYNYVYIHEDILADTNVISLLKEMKMPIVLIQNEHTNHPYESMYEDYFITTMKEDEMYDMVLPSKVTKKYCAYIDHDAHRIKKAATYGYGAIAINTIFIQHASLCFSTCDDVCKAMKHYTYKRYGKALSLFLISVSCVMCSMYLQDGFFAFTLILFAIVCFITSIIYAINHNAKVFSDLLDVIT